MSLRNRTCIASFYVLTGVFSRVCIHQTEQHSIPFDENSKRSNSRAFVYIWFAFGSAFGFRFTVVTFRGPVLKPPLRAHALGPVYEAPVTWLPCRKLASRCRSSAAADAYRRQISCTRVELVLLCIILLVGVTVPQHAAAAANIARFLI